MLPRFVLFSTVVFACALVAPAQGGDALPLGKIIDPVVCRGEPTQAYALYIPTNYTPDRRWPVIFCFDPGARGRVPVERFQSAAETYGYIVAGSLNSRNGPLPQNTAAAKAMVGDVSARLSLDPQRVYTAGQSGGSRVAAAFALAGWSKGVIGCCAGFPMDQDDIPWNLRFVYFGATGIGDPNFREMHRLDDELDGRKTAHRIAVFDGGHEWAPAATLGDAVEWLELQAMRAGTRPRDDRLIHAIWTKRSAAVPMTPALEHWRAVQALAEDFRGLADTSEQEKEATALAKSQPVRDELKRERALLIREEALLEDIADAAVGSSKKRAAFAAKLRAQADATEDSPERQMTRRAITGFIMLSREQIRMPDADDADSAALLEMATLLRPGQARTLLALARARARNGDKSAALSALESAAAAGLRAVTSLETDEAFAKIRSEARFAAVLTKVRDNAAQPPTGSEFEDGFDGGRRRRSR